MGWTRAGATITVAATGHGALTGDVIAVDTVSDAAIPVGDYLVTRLTADTFSIQGVSAGSVSGSTLAYNRAYTAGTINTAPSFYNNAVTGGLSAVTSNRYVPVYLIATNTTSEPVIAILGQGQSSNSTLATALTEAPFNFSNVVGLTSLGIQDMVPFYRVAVHYATTNTQSRAMLRDATFLNVRVSTLSGVVLGGGVTTVPASAVTMAPTAVLDAHYVQDALNLLGAAALEPVSSFAAADHDQDAATITSGTLDGARLPAISTSKRAGVPAAPTPTGLFLRDDDTWHMPPASGALVDVLPVSEALSTTMSTTTTLALTNSGFATLAPFEASGTLDQELVFMTTAKAAKAPAVSVLSSMPKYGRALAPTWNLSAPYTYGNHVPYSDGLLYVVAASGTLYSVRQLDADGNTLNTYSLDLIGAVVLVTGFAMDDTYFYLTGATFHQPTGRLLAVSSTVAASTVTLVSHGFIVGDPVQVNASVYWVRTAPTPDTFTVSGTPDVAAQASLGAGTTASITSIRVARGFAKYDRATLTLQTNTWAALAPSLSSHTNNYTKAICLCSGFIFLLDGYGMSAGSLAKLNGEGTAFVSTISMSGGGSRAARIYAGTSGLIVGGYFTSIRGVANDGVAILDPVTLAVSNFNIVGLVRVISVIEVGGVIYAVSQGSLSNSFTIHKKNADNSGVATITAPLMVSGTPVAASAAMAYDSVGNYLYITIKASVYVGVLRVDLANFTISPGTDCFSNADMFIETAAEPETLSVFGSYLTIPVTSIYQGNAPSISGARIAGFAIPSVPSVAATQAYVFGISGKRAADSAVFGSSTWSAETLVTVTEPGTSGFPEMNPSTPVTIDVGAVPAVGDTVFIRVFRRPSNADDTDAGKSWIHGIKVDWT